jgi:hypothetical protein
MACLFGSCEMLIGVSSWRILQMKAVQTQSKTMIWLVFSENESALVFLVSQSMGQQRL